MSKNAKNVKKASNILDKVRVLDAFKKPENERKKLRVMKNFKFCVLFLFLSKKSQCWIYPESIGIIRKVLELSGKLFGSTFSG